MQIIWVIHLFCDNYHMLIPGEVPEIDAKKVMEAIRNEEDVVILDVRTPLEYKKAHIAGSLNIPVDKIPKQVPITFKDKKRIFYVYCLSGSRSALASAELMQMGYKNVHNLTSGLLSWRSEGYPLSIID